MLVVLDIMQLNTASFYYVGLCFFSLFRVNQVGITKPFLCQGFRAFAIHSSWNYLPAPFKVFQIYNFPIPINIFVIHDFSTILGFNWRPEKKDSSRSFGILQNPSM